MSTSRFIIALLPYLMLCTACKKEVLTNVNVTSYQMPLPGQVQGIWFRDSLHGVAVGGTLWNQGLVFSTSNGGNSWQLDTTVRNRLECIMFDKNGMGQICGNDGLGLHSTETWGQWKIYRTDWFWAQSCHYVDETKGVVVGGEGWKIGQSRAYGPELFWRLDTTYQYNAELTDVWFSDENTVHAVGMGWVMRSSDSGHTWERLPYEGDFFQSVHFPDENTGYICGYQGNILKTTDKGQKWQTVRKGGTTGNKNQPFRAIWFVNPLEGWVGGENGIIWHTDDGANTWKTVENLDIDLDFTSVYAAGNTAWFGTAQGLVYRVVK